MIAQYKEKEVAMKKILTLAGCGLGLILSSMMIPALAGTAHRQASVSMLLISHAGMPIQFCAYTVIDTGETSIFPFDSYYFDSAQSQEKNTAIHDSKYSTIINDGSATVFTARLSPPTLSRSLAHIMAAIRTVPMMKAAPLTKAAASILLRIA